MFVNKLTAQEWKETLAKQAHEIVFREDWDADLERIDFALVTEDENGSMVQYATLKEMDRDSAYIQYGGAFPSFRNSKKSYDSFSSILDWLLERYINVGFLTENTNLPMLKFGIKKGFVIVGIRNFKGHIMLEHFKTREQK
jgi:hypothetical protein